MNTSKLISRMTVATLALGGLCYIQSASAVDNNAATYTSDNPHLRPALTTSKDAKAKQLSEKDKNFILQAASGGQQEVENGMMAEKKAQNAGTKMVAQRMVADHSKANKQLIALAKEKNLGVTTDNIHAQNMSGSNFDQMYLANLESVHKKDIAMFEKEARMGDDSDVKAWANKTLPTLKEHLAMIQGTHKKMK